MSTYAILVEDSQVSPEPKPEPDRQEWQETPELPSTPELPELDAPPVDPQDPPPIDPQDPPPVDPQDPPPDAPPVDPQYPPPELDAPPRFIIKAKGHESGKPDGRGEQAFADVSGRI